MPESHFSNQKELVTLYDQSSESEMEMTDSSKSGILTKKITTAALLAALSVAITPVASFLPRYPWGIAYFDPVSVFWIVAFLIGGLEVGLLSTVVGTIALLPFDPTGIGPMFKIAATLPMILILWLGTKWKGQHLGGKYLEMPLPYFGLIIIGCIVRILIMIPINLILVPLFFPGIGILDIVIVTAVLNSLQSGLESTISYNVVFSTRLFHQFGMW